MQHFKHRQYVGLVLILLAVWLGRPAASSATSPTHNLHCGGWSIVKSPNPDSRSDELFGVAAVSASDVWAVGYSNSAGTLIEHYDGASWQVVPSPSAVASALLGVAALSATDVWAVGRYYISQQALPLIEHWDGTHWSIVPAPNPGGAYVGLASVSAVSASDVWAVGSYEPGQGSAQETLIEHYDGTAWSVVRSPNVKKAWSFLNGVTALSSTDVWAVGFYNTGGVHAYPLSMHWDGTRWQVVPVPSHSTPSALDGVTALSSTDVWAVGSDGGPVYASWHWNGTHWKHVPVHPRQYGFAQAVAASSPDNVWSVGGVGANNTQAAHWDGTQWQLVPPRNHPRTPNVLYGVVMTSAQTVWAVGYYGPYGPTKTLIEYYC